MTRLLFLVVLLWSPFALSAQPSAVVSQSQATLDVADWGSFFAYFTGQTRSTQDLLAGVAVIRGGDEIHPPHRHAEEEFLIVTRGEGLWHLNGEEFGAKAGDMLYAAPWDVHGITNTGSDSLAFVVWKWNGAGFQIPQDPETDQHSAREGIEAAIALLSAATADGGGGPDAYGEVLTDDFSRWTLGAVTTDNKDSWLDSMRSWFDEGWRVASRQTHSMMVDASGDRAFVRRVVSESYRGPDGETTSPSKAAVSEVWVHTSGGWKLQRVEVVVLPEE